MTAPLLSIRDLTVDFSADTGDFRAVDGLSLDVPAGRTVALVGESGSGKSVTAQAILRILPKAARIGGGRILFTDPRRGRSVDIARLAAESSEMRALRGGRIAMIFQEPMTSLSPLHTVGDQVTEALLLHAAVSREEARRQAVAVFERVGFPDPKRALVTYPFELSGGLRQRAMIAMALITKPDLLVADEPTTALDVTTQAQILDLLRDLQAETGMAMLLITHDLGVVANVADSVAVLYRGRLMEAGSREDVFRRPGHPYLKALMRAVPRFHMQEGERLTPIREVRSAVLARKAGEPHRPDPPGPLLAVRDIAKSYTLRAGWFSGTVRRIDAVKGVSLELWPNRTLGLVGESGCGKTTLSKIVMRAIRPDAGSVTFDDGGGAGPRDVFALKDRELKDFRRAVQFVFQDPFSSLNPRMTVYEILTEPLRIHGVGTPDERYERAKELLDMVGLDTRSLRRYPHAFSGGQRQRLGIARALALKPRVLLCDEPVSALDVSVQAQVLNLLKDLQASLGISYLFVSHNLAVVDYIADTIAVMCRGRIVEEAPKAALFRNPAHPYTRALLAAVPEPDLDHPLDLKLLMSDRFSDPASWPEPFRLVGAETGTMQEISPGHCVRVSGSSLRQAA
ncbi:ABC transporter ATP-binding protein [Methylobacterium isbiliense]|uniref:Glutathione import ATP-binding protein GsiA n=1 Tax=Methylobacterium isbiliense TaxID=315478 RepID=A0ABQ4SHP6_9HYPH|nr:ABC transporter ATP-binding protein [Methylobacterium isbiliense]MDN3627795.1 ABC transporter ATP-binding protein [Methylobacterium isbiliense]GJE02632.1 Glutathione import ATP-binding protein GsiA [Methylobacterium isbiliense]